MSDTLKPAARAWAKVVGAMARLVKPPATAARTWAANGWVRTGAGQKTRSNGVMDSSFRVQARVRGKIGGVPSGPGQEVHHEPVKGVWRLLGQPVAGFIDGVGLDRLGIILHLADLELGHAAMPAAAHHHHRHA